MIWVYVAAAIFGGGFVIPALLGAIDFDSDVDFGDAELDTGGLEVDTDVDVGTDLDVDAELDADQDSATRHVVAGAGDWIGSLLTFRTLTFVALFFGLVGAALDRLSYGEPTPFVAALTLGLFAGVLNARLMAYLKRSDTTSHLTEQHLRGTLARVVLPITDGRRGRVEIDMAGQPTYMVALPYKDGSPDLDQGERVVVVEVRNGTAYVTAAPELSGGRN